ncbi:hypothetical protein [Streptomyces tailanensis]|uniref:hypothetical protein n=1 Tax=Streptomyces tailanensis TaxID=2569858 RepID=UPI00122E30B8|nr:hypothetical protein [Streptomyces tailanensis]
MVRELAEVGEPEDLDRLGAERPAQDGQYGVRDAAEVIGDAPVVGAARQFGHDRDDPAGGGGVHGPH